MADSIQQLNNEKDVKTKEIQKKNLTWIKEVRRGIERRGYFCNLKNHTSRNQPIQVLTFDYTIDGEKFKINLFVSLWKGNVKSTTKGQLILDTNVQEYTEPIKFADKLIEYLPKFFEEHYEETIPEKSQEESQETQAKNKENLEKEPEVVKQYAQEVKSNVPQTTVTNGTDLGDGVVIDAEVLDSAYTENYSYRMKYLSKLNEAFSQFI